MRKKTMDEFKKEVYDLVKDEYTILSTTYKNTNTKIKIRHNCEACNNHEYEVRPSNFLRGKRCPKCKYTKIANVLARSMDEFKKEVYEKYKDEYEILSTNYINSQTHIEVKHKCGNVYKVTPNNLLRGFGCAKCAFKESDGEKALVEFIDSIKSNNTIIRNDRRVIQPKELDILIPEIKVAFEYNGLYWHSEKYKGKKYHLDKTSACKQNDIMLIHIFEDEWLNKNKIVKSKINYLMKNTSNLEKVYARNCYVKEIDSKTKNKFLNDNHIQGEDLASVKLGLFTKKTDRLVSVMTFCNPRKSLGQAKDSEYDGELSRFASDINCIVIGGFSKLWSYFENNYEWTKIITYADKRWSQGNVYLKNGWKHLHDSKPNYWYCKSFERYHRYNFRKQVLKDKFPDIFDSNLTEFEIMDKTDYFRIWDCGNMVFEFSRI